MQRAACGPHGGALAQVVGAGPADPDHRCHHLTPSRAEVVAKGLLTRCYGGRIVSSNRGLTSPATTREGVAMSVAVEECLESAEVTDRVVFFGGKCATVTSTEGGHAVLGDGRTVSLSEARSSLLPEPGQPVLLYGSRVLWLGAGDVDAGYLHCLVLAGDRVEPRTITEATAVVQCPEAKELTARACAVLVGQWQRHEQWKRDLNEAANEYADQHELCER